MNTEHTTAEAQGFAGADPHHHATGFDEHEVLHKLKHFLPAQAPLKDFIHHNTLHAFQNQKFFEGIRNAAETFGYKVSMTLDEYRERYERKEIKKEILERVVSAKYGAEKDVWIKNLLEKDFHSYPASKVGRLRNFWKTDYKMDMDVLVHPILFRVLCSYLDQGISIWDFPTIGASFLSTVRELEIKAFTSFFRTRRARKLLTDGNCTLTSLLEIVVGKNTSLYENYLFDQQFAHQGWSGLVSTVEDLPTSMLDSKPISLHDLIVLELLFEIDALDFEHRRKWLPLDSIVSKVPVELFAPTEPAELSIAMQLWQEAFEWTYYDAVVSGIQQVPKPYASEDESKSFQAMFCIDDRECSLRRYLEKVDPKCHTFATPGFFTVEFFFKPEGGKFTTKLCPAPVTPKYLIKEIGGVSKRKKDVHLSKNSHSLARGWLISQTIGFWSATRLFINIFKPTAGPASASSFLHHDKVSRLTIECNNPEHLEDGLQVGFTIAEMVTRVETLLRSIGLVKNFAPIVYVVGHGSSSVNNPHYAAYDCGACSGRPGSVNARVFCHMANHQSVREELQRRGIDIPKATQFVGGLHDTTRDEIVFYDEDTLSPTNSDRHEKNEEVFAKALDLNAKERSRRLVLIDTKLSPEVVHKRVAMRSVSLFEPRPELNHATNALCIVGRRAMTQNLFLDRRAFLNSYDYRIDPDGKYLFGILRPAAPVCGGINLEYFFSRVDNQKLGAGSKLPHNVMGLFGVANGVDGDLRPGLPSQMIEVHDPVRLMIIVEHYPHVVLDTIKRQDETYEWFINEWVHLMVFNPETNELSYFKDGEFTLYNPLQKDLKGVKDVSVVIEAEEDNIPVFQMIP